MSFTTIDQPAFKVQGLGVRTRNADEMNPLTGKIPGLWGSFFASPLAAQAASQGAVGVYHGYESDYRGSFDVLAGVALADDAAPSAGMTVVEIPAGRYAVFECRGPMPQAVIAGWGQVWATFEQPDAPRRSYRADVEEYLGPDHARILIGLAD
ncbi:GyrI-like domain-containing protein [Paucibacter sp. APW11]|uniref:GyrI-like domain-containing protein n=1 Tax=Roseateles aquae TaxID=3077235 RepID=A0ABU3PGH4_9BURK|nr:GyrI-like domain-containing protein [Paucibacter sp. APW11]MDT9001701.1 GyrI-like domain-containing protein [Paucibacter sp. APW11]